MGLTIRDARKEYVNHGNLIVVESMVGCSQPFSTCWGGVVIVQTVII